MTSRPDLFGHSLLCIRNAEAFGDGWRCTCGRDQVVSQPEDPPMEAQPDAPAPNPVPNPITWEADAAPPEEPGAPQEAGPAPVQPVAPEEAPRPLPAVPAPRPGDAPYWAVIPQGLIIPRGRAAYFARFPSGWTDTPEEGMAGPLSEEDAVLFKMSGVASPRLWRQCIFWALSVGDQKIALGRANGDPNRFNTELCKQMIRSTDGLLVDRSDHSMDLWWERIGERCRSELTRMCVRIHSLTTQERAVFFGCCVASRVAG